MGSKPIVRKDSPINYLLVEGKDDEHVMYSLLTHHKIPEKFVVDPVEGVDNLLDAFEVRLTLGEFKCLGVIVDADDRLSDRWQKILYILKSTGYTNLPDAPDPLGTAITARYLDANAPHAQLLMAWIRKLFDLELV